MEAAGIDARMLAGRELLRVKLESMESCDPKQVGRLLAAGVHAANMPQHPPSTQALETQLTVATHAAETQAGTGLSRVTCHRFTCSVQRLPSWTTTSTMNWPAMSACKSRHSLCHPFCCAVCRNIIDICTCSEEEERQKLLAEIAALKAAAAASAAGFEKVPL